jgi:glutamate/tyrosine decarboxylase-like PLP-dependent enzyme
MLLGSVPPWTHGVCDPIGDLAGIARRHDIWLHVDACVGGFLAPFVRRLGRPVPDYDFSIAGVASISADLHKYGYGPKGASTICLRATELRGGQHFTFDDWQAGLYRAPVITGTRSAGPIVGAWAVMSYLGKAGYLRRADQILRAKDKITAVIDGDDDLVLYGRPELATLTFGARELDIFAVSETLASRGWTINRCRDPEGIQFVLGPLKDAVADELAGDLAWAVADVRKNGRRRASGDVVYSDEIF